ncbi:hypothetical protein O181_124087 [Austropuccinia psidii MF-1]|uniref:Uncharacterized protein n=1 Tax=Austropuccinia psidii MF-1 TaxID=1389203 RepID=A0A9Q3KRC7_9BASI|nr:hypothetical protein [Austropuccinia psidii MF-1]
MLPTTYPYACVVPSRHAPNTAYHPYARGACVVPSRHPHACRVHSQHAPDTTYPYTCVVPSQHAPDTAYHPYACRLHSQHFLPSLGLLSALLTCSRHHLSLCSRSASQHAPNTTYPYARRVPS